MDADKKEDLWILPMEGERQPVAWTRSPFRETLAQFSPDGRWIAYQSDQSGRFEVYVRPFTPAAAGTQATESVYQVSKDGGQRPLWTADGRELIYFGPDRMLIAVGVTATSRFQTGSPRPLFPLPGSASILNVALHPDGRRLLIPSPAGGTRSPITAAINWQEALRPEDKND